MAADVPETDNAPDDSSLVSVLDTFGEDGWTANHLVQEGARMKCGECGELTAASELTVSARHRIEGASDPSDMQAVFGIECPACGAKGSLAAGYGPEASEQDADFTSDLDETNEPPDPLAASN
ncbi:hypothetical protein [Ilumatobacter sp.]|uniref:hypothetical protein n=1 Tax=Ilumatobacter sp. TaxID=1967498 RepID=UPI003B516A5F